MKLAFVASDSHQAQAVLEAIREKYAPVEPEHAVVIVALGGDGLLLAPTGGGTAGVMRQLTAAQAQIGHQVTVYTSDINYDPDFAAEAVSENDIPRKYESSVKKYFGDLEGTARPAK